MNIPKITWIDGRSVGHSGCCWNGCRSLLKVCGTSFRRRQRSVKRKVVVPFISCELWSAWTDLIYNPFFRGYQVTIIYDVYQIVTMLPPYTLVRAPLWRTDKNARIMDQL
ncbi:hypothetical protein CEXT_570361 [Caerostris extrusa]|uniref:Uncharacterized protein n=1 Tax=Caerostris extrusa TaxID=172846 RepID=A0AAV4QGQ7_CAEEX|nr:hypothetical protein CEXT_570361 [Caerostris extrusa]